jgi:hypothetical protein
LLTLAGSQTLKAGVRKDEMKKTLYLALGLVVGLIGGYVIGGSLQPKIRPKMQQYLRLTFGTSNPAAVSDKDAQIMIDAARDYANEQAHDQTIFWQVMAICKLKELDATGKPQRADDYVNSTVKYFLEVYQSTNYIPGFAKFADKLYRDLGSDKAKIDISTFEHRGGG